MTLAPIRLGVVGLGVMGRTMLAAAMQHPDFVVTRVADADPAAVQRVREQHPGIDAGEVIGAEPVDAVYVATPPATHAAFVVPALESGQAVFCEKPLAVSAADAEVMLAAARTAARATAVNFSLADRLTTQYVEQAIADGRVGEVLAVEIRLVFPVWPREFQAAAEWVGGREQGGFVREVFSHFAYLTDRLVGPLRPVHVVLAHRGDGSETAAYGLLRAGEIPVQLTGVVGAGPRTAEWVLRGTRQSYRLSNWRDLSVAEGNGWTPVPETVEPGSEANRLALFARAIRGEQSRDLADFSTAYRVQRAVAAFHSA